MRVPRWLAWSLLILAFFTAGLIRQFNEATPRSPYIHPVVGSLLFAEVLLLLLVAARERRVGAVRGPGVRLGSLTPLLLMLLIEKWASLSFYEPLFYLLAPAGLSDRQADAAYRMLAGVGLLLICGLLFGLSAPAARRTLKRLRPSGIPMAVGAWVAMASASLLATGGIGAAAGADISLRWSTAEGAAFLILVSQAVRSFAEEVYYRGLLLAESQRLAPRLGLRSAALRRWSALGLTSTLFALEHWTLSSQSTESLRLFLFTLSLGLLLGILVMLSWNLYLASLVHFWINALLLGVAPHWVTADGRPFPAPGAQIGLLLMFAFLALWLMGGVSAGTSRRSATEGVR